MTPLANWIVLGFGLLSFVANSAAAAPLHADVVIFALQAHRPVQKIDVNALAGNCEAKTRFA